MFLRFQGLLDQLLDHLLGQVRGLVLQSVCQFPIVHDALHSQS